MSEEKYVSGEQFRDMHRQKSSQPEDFKLNKRLSLGIGLVVLLCVVSFVLGVSYQKHNTKSLASTNGSASGSAFAGGSRRLGGFGQVSAISSTSISVTNTRSGAVTTYAITPATVITDSGQPSDITSIVAGGNVLVGTSSSDATTATTISVNPTLTRPGATAPTN